MGLWNLGIAIDYIMQSYGLSRTEKLRVHSIVMRGINETRTHISRTRKEHGDIPSQILSNTWMETANELQRTNDQNLEQVAKMLYQKSKYWSDPTGYQPDELDQYDISLNNVEAELKKLIA